MIARRVGRYGFVLQTAARQQWIYRGELVARAISMVLFLGILMALWTTTFGVSGRSELAGYSLVEVAWYLAMTETIMLSTSRVFVEISEAVKGGDLAYTLSRPLSYPLYQVANSLGGTLPRFLLNLLTATFVAAVAVKSTAGSIPGLVAYLGLAALGLAVDALIAVLIGLTAFWIEEVQPVFWIYQKLLFTIGGLLLPLDMFPTELRRVVQWLPFQFITYGPARAFVAFDPLHVTRIAAGQVLYIALLATLVLLVWKRAQRRMVVHGG